MSDQERLDFLKLEYSEINQYMRLFLQSIMAWYTFFLTISIAVIGTTIIKFAEPDGAKNTSLVLIVLLVIAGFSIGTTLAMFITYQGISVFGKRIDRMQEICDAINSIVGPSTIHVPFEKDLFAWGVKAINKSIGILWVFWLGLFFYVLNIWLHLLR